MRTRRLGKTEIKVSELVLGGGHQYYYPYTVIIDGEHQPIKYLPGFYPAIRLKRDLLQLIK